LESLKGIIVGTFIPGTIEDGFSQLPGSDAVTTIRALESQLPDNSCVWAMPARQNGIRGFKILKIVGVENE